MEQKCVEYALTILSGKWKLKIIWELNREKTIRFNELRRRLSGISNNMLAKSLQELEEVNLVSRIQYNEIPPRVEYSLSELGNALQPSLQKISEWALQVAAQANTVTQNAENAGCETIK